MRKVTCVFLLTLSYFVYAQNMDGKILEVIAPLQDYATNYPLEKCYVHTDKHLYAPGETIWYQLYLVDGRLLTATAQSKTAYVDLIDGAGEVRDRAKLEVIDGVASGYLVIPDDTLNSSYQIVAWTQFQKNWPEEYFFRQEIQLAKNSASNNQKSKPSIAIYPESGYLVERIPSKVGIKIDGSIAKSYSGVIRSDDGVVAARFKTNPMGLGSCLFVPQPGKQYELVVDEEDISMKMPEAQKDGFVISASHSGDKLSLKMYSNTGNLAGSYIVGHIRGNTVLAAKIEQATTSALALPKANLYPGIMHLTLFDKDMVPRAERLVFIEGNRTSSSGELTVNENTLGKRQKQIVTFKPEAPDESQINLSATVVNVNLLDSTIANIEASLLLQSDIPDDVVNLGYYFHNGPKIDEIDNIMLTHGWRRFTWKQLLQNELPTYSHQVETGLTISGQVVNYDYRKEKESAEVTLTPADDPTALQKLKTMDGAFQFTDLVYYDTARFYLQSNGLNKKGKVLKNQAPHYIKIDNLTLPTYDFELPNRPTPEEEKMDEVTAAYEILDYVQQVQQAYDTNAVFILPAMEIRTRRAYTEKNTTEQATVYGQPSNRLNLDSIGAQGNPGNVFELIQGRIPGVTVTGSGTNISVLVRGVNSFSNSDPLILVDNTVVDIQSAVLIPAADVQYVDVLKGADAAIFGARGGNGVISIITKRGGDFTDPRLNWGIRDVTLSGYQVSREFYTPDYSKKKSSRPDYRSTLHWEPNITSEGKPVKFDFYTSDQSGTYQVIMMGISQKGKIYSEVTSFEVR